SLATATAPAVLGPGGAIAGPPENTSGCATGSTALRSQTATSRAAGPGSSSTCLVEARSDGQLPRAQQVGQALALFGVQHGVGLLQRRHHGLAQAFGALDALVGGPFSLLG